MSDAAGVVVTGVYGVGKSSVVEEMAELLEQDSVSYGALDIDWLWWFDVPGLDDEASRQVLFANLKSVARNYLDAGVIRFLLAWSIRSQEDLDALRGAVPFSLRVIHLTASIDLIRERLAPAVTAGRQQDLLNSEKWLRERTGSNLGAVTVANDRPIRAVATEILDLLEWHSSSP
jgi:gluconate kinase